MERNELEYIDQLIKQKLDNYSVPVNLSPDKIFKSRKTYKRLLKWIGAGVTFIGIFIASIIGINKKPAPALQSVMPKYKIEHIRQVTKVETENIEQPQIKRQHKQPNKKIVVVKIEQTEKDTIRK